MTAARYGSRDARRAVLADQIVTDLRVYSRHAQHMGQAVAAVHRLGATDREALIAIMDAEGAGDPLTPARLGELLSLPSDSVTGVIDRLERAGQLERRGDAADRRTAELHHAEQSARVTVEPSGPIIRRSGAVLDRFSDDELEVVHRFLREMVTAMAEQRSAVRAPEPDPGGPNA